MIGKRSLVNYEKDYDVRNDIFLETLFAYHRVLWETPLKSARPQSVLDAPHRGKSGAISLLVSNLFEVFCTGRVLGLFSYGTYEMCF